jgi:tetrahydromethanopterin S-methyltransferase subunit A
MATVEERLERLEKEVTLLKLSQSSKVDIAAKKPGWVAKIEGSFKDDPEFAEILRLGREERQADIVQPGTSG